MPGVFLWPVVGRGSPNHSRGIICTQDAISGEANVCWRNKIALTVFSTSVMVITMCSIDSRNELSDIAKRLKDRDETATASKRDDIIVDIQDRAA